jgi:hypothetical protein
MQLSERVNYRKFLFGVCTRICLGAWLAGTLVAAVNAWDGDLSELPPPFLEKIELAQDMCADFENGTFSLEWGAVVRADLDGDLDTDWVLNESGFACSSAPSLYCNTGGCLSHFLIGQEIQSLLNRGWNIVTFGPDRVLLADVHGSQCGGINPTPCTVASIWDSEATRWRSAGAKWE